jgi:hypothetical protein
LRRPRPIHGCTADDDGDDNDDDEKITGINHLFLPTIPRNMATLVPSLYQLLVSSRVNLHRHLTFNLSAVRQTTVNKVFYRWTEEVKIARREIWALRPGD